LTSNQNPAGSVTRGVGGRRASTEGVGDPTIASKLRMPSMPVEWLDSGSWRLPSGKALAEFALQAGFLAPLLFRAEGFGKGGLKSAVNSAGIAPSVSQTRSRQFGKGDGR